MSDKTTAFHIKQVEGEINQLFADLIDMSDCENKKKNDKDNVFNSRALAAYSLHILAETSPSIAAEAVVDGCDDNGIDAFLFNEKQKTLWVVQSKWIQNGQGSPKQPDMKTFRDGIFDLLDFDRKAKRFNEKFQKREDEIIAITKTPALKIKVIIAYTGSKLSNHARTVLEEDCIAALNYPNDDVASLEEFDLEKAYNAVIDSHKYEDIEVSFTLSNWGKADDDTYPAYYGQIGAIEVARWWVHHKNKLFSKNIRDFLGNSNVNSEIVKTIENEPRLFWYFNNGITVLCNDIQRLGAKTDKRLGQFTAKGISIVNGAQTMGSIGAFYEEATEEQKENWVHPTFHSFNKNK
jgi:hypothetical protein